MQYYDATVGKVRVTMEKEDCTSSHATKAKQIQNILSLIVITLMAITVIFQLVWFNIVLHTVLCSVIIALCLGILICAIIQGDKSIIHASAWIAFWLTNLVINLIKHFLV